MTVKLFEIPKFISLSWLLSLSIIALFALTPSRVSAQIEIPGITPPINFDWSAFELDRHYAKSVGDDLIDYDMAVSKCAGMYEGKVPDAVDLFYTEEKLAKLEKCMLTQGYRFRAVDDFSAYESVPSQEQVETMIRAAQEQMSRSGRGAIPSPDSQSNVMSNQFPGDKTDAGDKAMNSDHTNDTVREAIEDTVENRPNTGQEQERKPTHLFVPLD